MNQSKVNLDAKQQVEHLKAKGVTFDLMTELEAIDFLNNRNYFFRIKAFAKNYDKRIGTKCGQYINLDFMYLAELSRLDQLFRDLILKVSLGIEHNLKVRINRIAMQNAVDPYLLLESFFGNSYSDAWLRWEAGHSDKNRESSIVLIDELRNLLLKSTSDEIIASPSTICRIQHAASRISDGVIFDYERNIASEKNPSSYSEQLVSHYKDRRIPYWYFMELASFGSLISFYKACFSKEGLLESPEEQAVLKDIKNILFRTKVLRNAAAHGDCLLNSLNCVKRSKSLTGTAKKLCQYDIDEALVSANSRVQFSMDLAAIFMCYDKVVPRGNSKKRIGRELFRVHERLFENAGFFKRNYAISQFLNYADSLLRLFQTEFEL